MNALWDLPEFDESEVIYDCPHSPLPLIGIGLLFTAFGVLGLIMSLRHVTPFGLAFSVVWLAGVWWYLLNYAYGVTLMANGDIQFRLLWGDRVINASNVTSIEVRRGEGTRWLVVEAGGPGIHMSKSSCHLELVRLIGEMNPEAELPLEISRSLDDEDK
jgi:hypothetical protein